MIRFALAASLLVVSVAAPAAAQPVVEAQAGMQAPTPVAPQPMRFILTSGAILIGTEAGGDAEWLLIQTSTGVVQVRRAEIASMDYQVGQGAVTVVAPQPAPPAVQYASPPPRRRGRGLLIAGSVVFGISYGLSALIGVTAAQESPSALWFLLPVAGPLLWAQNTDCSGELSSACRTLAVTFGTFITIVQAAGMAMLVVGISLGSSSDPAQAEAEGPRLARAHPSLELSPVFGPGLQGLALRTTF